VKENTISPADSRSSDKLMHNIKVAIARNYVDNLSEEVKKGLREKADQGHFPGVAHVGYVNNRVTRRIDVDPIRGPLMTRVFERTRQASTQGADGESVWHRAPPLAR
jgi:DNA invertase Pin-like site-specific DNA recombinase